MTCSQQTIEDSLWPLVKAIKNPEDYNLTNDFLKQFNLRYVDQFLSNDGKSTRSWVDCSDLFPHLTRTNKIHIAPYAYARIIQAISIPPHETLGDPDSPRNLVIQASIRHIIHPRFRPTWKINPFFDNFEETRPQIVNPTRTQTKRGGKPPQYLPTPYDWAPTPVLNNEIKQPHPQIDITPRKWDSTPQEPTQEKAIKEFLDEASRRNETILIYTDGSCRQADTPAAEAGSGILMIMKSDYLRFTTQYQDPNDLNQKTYDEAFEDEYVSLGESRT